MLRRENAEKRRITLDKINKTDIIIAVKQLNAMTKPVSRNGSKREGDGASPLFTPQNSHFGAVCDEQDFLTRWQYIDNNPAAWLEDDYYID